MRFEKLDADVHTVNHIEKVGLENERLARVIEQARRMLQFLKIFQSRPDSRLQLHQLVL
jgi:hypothetical protein